MIDFLLKIRYDNKNGKPSGGDTRMKGLLKFFTSLLALFGALVGALAVFDRISNRNRIKGDYLECDCSQKEE